MMAMIIIKEAMIGGLWLAAFVACTGEWLL